MFGFLLKLMQNWAKVDHCNNSMNGFHIEKENGR